MLSLGLGCAWLGRRGQEQWSADIGVLESAYRQGCRYFDTAPAYGDSELLTGEFLSTIPRGEVFIATKIEKCDAPDLPFVQRIAESVDRSLARLRTGWIDLVQLHDTSIRDLIAKAGQNALEDVVSELREQGKIRYFGLATRDHGELLAALDLNFVDTVLSYNDCTPIDFTAAHVIAAAAARLRLFINGSPLCSGLLNGGNPLDRQVDPALVERQQRASLFHEFCIREGVETPSAALAFPLRIQGIGITLTGPRNLGELNTNISAAQPYLPGDFWERWNQVLATYKQQCRQ